VGNGYHVSATTTTISKSIYFKENLFGSHTQKEGKKKKKKKKKGLGRSGSAILRSGGGNTMYHSHIRYTHGDW
jgi:hypothetical protein